MTIVSKSLRITEFQLTVLTDAVVIPKTVVSVETKSIVWKWKGNSSGLLMDLLDSTGLGRTLISEEPKWYFAILVQFSRPRAGALKSTECGVQLHIASSLEHAPRIRDDVCKG